MLKGKWGGQLQQNSHNPITSARTMTIEPRPVAMNNYQDRQPSMPTMACHAPAAPPQPSPLASTITMTTTKASGETSYPTEGGADNATHHAPFTKEVAA
jgi:hypothetical protein